MKNMKSPFFNDMAKIAGNAMGSLAMMKNEMEATIRHKIETYLANMQLVPREEFEVQKEIIANLRENQAMLEERIERLEALQRTKQGDQE